MLKHTFLSILLLQIGFFARGQNVLILQPNSSEGKDIEIFNLQPNVTLDGESLRGNAWTFSGNEGIVRGLIEFDLSSIPTGSKVDSAFLSLYSPASPSSQTHSGDNESFLKRITSYWGEAECNWNIQPSTTDLHRVSLPRANGDYQDYLNINVTGLVHDMVNDPANSFGFMLMLQHEDIYRRLSFASSDAAESSNHPRLVVHYTPPPCITIVLRPGSAGKDAEIFDLEPNTTFNLESLRGNAWTFSGPEGIVRGLLEFDLTGIPPTASVSGAYLSLFSPDYPHTQFHSGVNSAWLQRITSNWNETTVNWNNQPSTTPVNQVSVPSSTLEYQDYRNIDVTTLINDMLDDPTHSFGFMLQLQTEEFYRRIGFASGDYINENKHPRLEICYTGSVSVEGKPDDKTDIFIFPNPMRDWIQINSTEYPDHCQLQVYNLTGSLIISQEVETNTKIDFSNLLPGIYIFKLTETTSGHTFLTKIVQQ